MAPLFVRTIASDSPWAGAVELPWEPDWDDATLAALVEELDGVERTALVLTGPDNAHLAIGGSALAGLIVYVSYDEEQFALAGGSDDEGTRPVVAGGTVQDYPLRYVIEPAVAVQAAWTFVQYGELDDTWEWDRG
ncbi:immunity protein Imm1 of predicted polymorphic toxin system [Motilibacter peucedani]|uniref:Immunity protein Imm1 of predicted polymorphic toxin system n=1 Tax=Motilibacter peucedani TaxID=598650 RepID=A0A420XQA5_9ACTN|nr:Imm1 family immunity protein [Motilibacter peucedani]RKS75402.1 immunity protein Imm1 of predicted polymorphic toxin system [Motilibacter peucedani]